MNDYRLAGQQGQNQAVFLGGQATKEVEERAIPRAMTDLACSIGELETVARSLLDQISRLIPGGSPFNRPDPTVAAGGNASQIQPTHSHHHDEIQSRVYQLREITARLSEAARGVEV
jgi:hypothetical protein